MAVEEATSGRRDDSGVRGPLLRVRLLGGVDLRLGDVPVPPLESARAESLLAYLLLHRGAALQRQHVAFTLWPDSTEPQARTNLRHVLHKLRRALPEADRFIDVGQRTLRWRTEVPLRLDVDAFEQAVAEGRVADAIDAYTGDLLEGNYDDWVLEERERLSQLHLVALEGLARDLEAQGRVAEAIGYAERLLRHDPLREDAYRFLIRLHDAVGDRAGALRTYHACATTLVRELGIEPSAATRDAYDALLGAAPEPGSPEQQTPDRAPLVGRRAERELLSELWRASERGRAQLVLVTGEAGIGKSRLLEELRSWCAHRGAATAEARSYAVEGAMAYGALVAWLRTEPIRSRLRRLGPAHLTELARLLPELAAEVQGLPAPVALPEDELRQRLFAAAAEAILAAGTPLLLVAEDVHWCDPQTLQFVHYLLRTEPGACVLVAASARGEELEPGHRVVELVAAVQALGVATEVVLERLGRDETIQLAERIAGRPLAAAEAERCYEESEGVPLFLVEALRAETGVSTAAGGTSDRVRAVIVSRLARLSEPAGELVGVAATIGREFTVQVLAAASGSSEDALVRGLDELWRKAILRARGPNAYDFSHAKIREAAYGALSPASARRHHLRVANALQRSPAEDVDTTSGQIAAHYESAGAAEEAIDWHVRAAEAAQRLSANADAVRSLERAFALVADLPETGERDALELRLLTRLPVPLLALEGYQSARIAEVHERALELAGASGVELAGPLVRSLALASLARGDFDAGEQLGAQLRARGERGHDDVLTIEGAYVLGITAYWQGRLASARTQFEDAIERCRPEHQPVHLARYAQDPEIVCLTRLAHTLWLLGEQEAAERARDRGLELAAERGHQYSLAVAHVFAAVLALDQGDEERLRRHALELPASISAYAAPQIWIAADAFAGLLEVYGAGSAQAAARVSSTVADARRQPPATPGFHAVMVRILLEAYARAGDAEAGLLAAGEVLGMGGGTQLWEAEIRRLRAGFLAARGAPAREVERELERAIEVAQRQGARAFELRARADLERPERGTR